MGDTDRMDEPQVPKVVLIHFYMQIDVNKFTIYGLSMAFSSSKKRKCRFNLDFRLSG